MVAFIYISLPSRFVFPSGFLFSDPGVEANMKFNTEFDGHPIEFTLRPGAVNIKNDPSLWSFITADPRVNTQRLVDYLNELHFEHHGRRFEISDSSFILEIWGHLYLDKFLVDNPKLAKIIFPFGLYDRFVRAGITIDCGEAEVDTNRWFWDLFSFLTPLSGRILARR